MYGTNGEDWQVVHIKVIGTSPLVVGRFPWKMTTGLGRDQEMASDNGATATKKPAAKKEEQVIRIPGPNLQVAHIRIIGVSSLISHKWSEKATKQMLDKQQKKVGKAKEAKDPERDFRESLYEHPDGGYAFPSIAFKSAAVTACTQIDGITKVFARGAFHVLGEWVKIEGEPHSRQDMVRIGMGTADIRYRGEFDEWSATIPVQYNANVISTEQLLNLFQQAGFSVGIGEWRPERDGQHGMFRLATDEDD